ncbi:MAG TPA: helix-turn-helix domain-containing protein [Streptosporangiaceae bacterium]|nr:helix-turn-helix domain-containing protein [Streptosporangiaceae bacterium]
MPSPKLVPLVLSDAERASLEALSRIVLACAEAGGAAALTRVAGRTGGVSRESVRKWRVRFLAERMKGLADAPRPGAPRKITDEQVEVVVTRVLTEKGPGQDTHWSTRAMAAQTGLSQSSASSCPRLGTRWCWRWTRKARSRLIRGTIRASVIAGKRVVVLSACHSRTGYQ